MRLLSIVLSAFVLFSAFAYGEEITRIIAKVNNEVITSHDLGEYCMALTYQESGAVNQASCQDPEFLGKILGRLVEDRLILAKARGEEFDIPRHWIDDRFHQMIDAYPSREEFEKSLVQKGLTVTRVKEKIKDQFLMQGVIEKYVKTFAVVSPQEVSDYYNENLDKFYSPTKYIFYMTKSESQGKLKEVSGVIIEKGIHGANDQYDDILIRIESTKSDLREDIFSMIDKVQAGGHVIGQSKGEFYLIYLEEITEPESLALEDAREEIYAYLREKKFKERFAEWVEEVKNNSVIQIYHE